MVSKANIWGALASTKRIWREDGHICIRACEVNQAEKRIDMRSFSSVVLANADQTFPKPDKLEFISFVGVEP